MKTSKSHQFLSVVMTILVTMSSFSMTIKSHYCGDELIDMSIFNDTDACMTSDACSLTEEIENFECCYDIVDVVESHEFLKSGNFDDFNPIQKHFFLSYLNTLTVLYEPLQKRTIPNPYYKPPPLVYDIHCLDEVYLI
ncbi:MAG: HYC_CC_PP family protein [Aquaticitalea sp.]